MSTTDNLIACGYQASFTFHILIFPATPLHEVAGNGVAKQRA